MKKKSTMKFQPYWLVLFYFSLNLLPIQIFGQGFIESSTYLPEHVYSVTESVVSNGESYILGRYNISGQIVSRITKIDATGSIVWGRTLTNATSDYISKIKVVNGTVYATGYSSSTNYPVTNGSTRVGTTGSTAVYTKMDASTGAIQFSTYLSTRGQLFDIEVVDGAVYLAGNGVNSFNNFDLVVVKYDDNTNNQLFLTSIGGSGQEQYAKDDGIGRPRLQVVNNKIYIAGTSGSADFPVTNGSVAVDNSGNVYVKMDAITGSVDFASYFGSRESLQVIELKVADGGVYIVANTDDTEVPVTDGSFFKGGYYDGFITKFNDSTGAIEFTKYIGSTGLDYIIGVEVENGVVYVVTDVWDESPGLGIDSENFPITTGYPTTRGGGDYAVTKMDAATGNIIYSRFISSLEGAETATSIRLINGELYIAGLSNADDYPVTNGSVLASKLNAQYDAVITKIDANNKICFSAFVGGTGNETDMVKLHLENGKVYLTGITVSNDFPVTNNSSFAQFRNAFATVFDLTTALTPSEDTPSPASQSTCKNGLAQEIEGDVLTFSGVSIPTIYRNGVSGVQTLVSPQYQWQKSDAAGGPWANIPGAVKVNYKPQVGIIDQYYRRITSASGCSGIISTSSVASVLVNGFTAPTITAGEVLNTCVDTPVALNVTATGADGATIESYLWTPTGTYVPNNAVANPTVTPSTTTIYTVTVTDNNGCQQIGQTLVNTYKADAGPETASTCADQIVRIGTPAIAGLSGVQYAWTASPADPTMSCTNCAQPDVHPTVVTTYTLSLTIPVSGGGTCVTTDSIIVSPVAAPTANFAGTDVTICSGSTATLGVPTQAGFTYTWAPGNYLQSNHSAQAVFQPGSFSLPNPDPFTYYVTALKGGCTFVDEVKATVIEARAGVDGCGPRTLGMPDRTPNINETYAWTVVTGDSHIIGATNSPQVNVGPSTGSTTYRLTVTYNGVSCTDDVVVPSCGCPVPNIAITAPNSCASYDLNGGNVTLWASSSMNSTFEWTTTGGITLSSYTGSTVTLTNNAYGTVTVKSTSVIDPTYFCYNTITVNNPAWSLPVFTAQDQEVCPGVPVNIGQTTVEGYSYLWKGNNLSNNTISDPVATVNSTAHFSVLVTDVISGCTVTDTATVSIPGFPANIAGEDIKLCGSSSVVQLGLTPQTGFTYIWTPASTYTPNNTVANPTVPIATTSTFTVVATNTATGCSVTDDITVTVSPAVDPFTFTNQTFCPSETGAIPLPAGPSGMSSYSWSPASLVVASTQNGPTATTQNPRPQVATTYTLTVTNADGCTGAASVVFTPSVSLPEVASNQRICKGSSAQLGGTDLGGTYSWSPSTGLDNPNLANPVFTADAAGTFTYTVSRTDPGGCVTTAQVTITVADVTLPVLVSPTVCQNSSIQIGTTPVPDVQYIWSPVTGLSDPTIANPIATVTTSSQSYTLTAVAVNGCSDTKSLIVGVNAVPAPTVTIPDVAACLGSGTATFVPTVSPAGTYSYVWSPNNGTIENIYAQNASVLVTDAGIKNYSLTVTNTETGCASDATVKLTTTGCAAVILASLGDRVWYDNGDGGGTLNDGIQNGTEPGVDGVTVTIYNGDVLIGTTVTANGGYYFFGDLTPGIPYTVKFLIPEGGYQASPQDASAGSEANDSDGSSAMSGEISTASPVILAEGEHNPNIDLGIVLTSALPVRLINFSGQGQEGAVQLKWTVAEEINTSEYQIEHSTNAVRFKTVGSVKAAQKERYDFVHEGTVAGTNYYRLKMVDSGADRLDGSFAFSKIISVASERGVELKVYPNPAVDILYIEASKGAGIVDVEIINVAGVTVHKSNGKFSDKGLKIDKLPVGLYVVHVKLENGTSTYSKVIIQR